ncbi:hypothetical protein G7B40_009840 [Aetokthonos hydrillicola Thurmond2011]|uniref:Uncharacterized protein n=1 Tax=Aetokthonos hydrillicola Thurmond2011 TaxID=2712845 RepID=A0AAP5I6V8_9CYAN|nr:hypothetical protein [Aetokthonos hydrillicola]MBW4590083.1 hypothetical protein [Aetokthonos hydrillicola CCALA 1050]MDR9894864.1 hypothetical protein [Aetokthonos hydrillicola Thurmond2011]
MRVSTSLNSRSLSWLSEAETNCGGIFIPVDHLSSQESGVRSQNRMRIYAEY